MYGVCGPPCTRHGGPAPSRLTGSARPFLGVTNQALHPPRDRVSGAGSGRRKAGSCGHRELTDKCSRQCRRGFRNLGANKCSCELFPGQIGDLAKTMPRCRAPSSSPANLRRHASSRRFSHTADIGAPRPAAVGQPPQPRAGGPLSARGRHRSPPAGPRSIAASDDRSRWAGRAGPWGRGSLSPSAGRRRDSASGFRGRPR